MENIIGQNIGHYQILEVIGQGGMAVVYKAKDTRLNRLVAFKIVSPSVRQPEVALKRFEREAKTLAQLNHPNIVKILDYGEYDGWPYLVMEYVTGGTLKQVMGKQLPWRETVEYILPIAHALEYAHQHEVIHRDIKPSNILLDENGRPLLSDFGIAKVVAEQSETADLTGTGLGVGTPDYMAPEQIVDNLADPRTDIYSLGLVMYEMLCGRKPFRAGTPAGVMVKQVNTALPRPGIYVKGLPVAVETMIVRTLAKQPDQRYSSMGVLITVLEDLLAGKIKASPARRNFGKTALVVGGMVGIFGLAVLLGVGIMGGYLFLKGTADRNAQIPATNLPPVSSTIVSIPEVIESPGTVKDSNALFRDDFSDPASGWKREHTPEGMTDYFNGSYRIFINITQTNSWVRPQLNFDQDVSVQVLATKNGGPDNNEFGVICQYQKTDTAYNFYYFVISSQGFGAIGKVIDGKAASLERTSAPSEVIHLGSSSNRIQATCSSDMLILTVNGEQILMSTDHSLDHGDVGLIAGSYSEPGTDILFDDFIVTTP